MYLLQLQSPAESHYPRHAPTLEQLNPGLCLAQWQHFELLPRTELAAYDQHDLPVESLDA